LHQVDAKSGGEAEIAAADRLAERVWAGVDAELRHSLEARLGARYARQRLGIEKDHEAQVFGQGINVFHIENLLASHKFIRGVLKAACLYEIGRRNAARIVPRHNEVPSRLIPRGLDGFTILQLSDLHTDMSQDAMASLAELLPGLDYDLCVLTGDYRGLTYGPFEASLAGMRTLCLKLEGVIYGVLGNHDTILMVPGLEAMGVKMLLNEAVIIEREGARLHLAGIDDAHFFRVDNIEKAASGIPAHEFSVLLSHTPEIYRQAAHADFDLLLAGHTHGGQICLPGGIPITLDAVLPRSMGAGAWAYHGMVGYTSAGAGSSVVPVRFNCPPEITLHHLRRVEP
jgi:predicted MPP superfamily phosphohydrolase